MTPAHGNITIVLDNYPFHRGAAAIVAAPALARAGVTFYSLPSYSPERNGIEPLWRRLKYDDLATRGLAAGEALHAAVDGALAKRAAEFQHATHKLSRAA